MNAFTAADKRLVQERRRVDRLEYAVRASCGAAIGSLLGVAAFLHGSPVWLVVLIPVLTLVAAARYGDRFWYWLFESRWFPWI